VEKAAGGRKRLFCQISQGFSACREMPKSRLIHDLPVDLARGHEQLEDPGPPRREQIIRVHVRQVNKITREGECAVG